MHQFNGVGVIFCPLFEELLFPSSTCRGQQCDNRAVMCAEAPADGALTHTEWLTDFDVISLMC